MEEMDENELREFLKYVQQNRASAISFRAEAVRVAEGVETKKEAKKSVGFEDLV